MRRAVQVIQELLLINSDDCNKKSHFFQVTNRMLLLSTECTGASRTLRRSAEDGQPW